MFSPDTRILVLDDMSTMRVLIRNQLRTMGFKNLLEGENGVRGWEVLNQELEKKTPVQLVLSDWNMPEMQGIELLKKVRASDQFKTLPFVLITAEGEASQVKEAILAGVSSYIVKPFTPATLTEKLTAVWKKLNPG